MTQEEKHGEFISFKIAEEKAIAFIDGVPDKCQHEWDGKGYDIISSISGRGSDEYIESIASQKEYCKKDAELRKEGKYLSGGCVSCSKCGKPFEPDMFLI